MLKALNNLIPAPERAQSLSAWKRRLLA